MAEVTKKLPFDKAVKEIMSRVSCSESRARFIAAIERGEIDGDEYVVDPVAESEQEARRGKSRRKRPAA